MDQKALFETFAQYGIIGVMLFIVLYAYYKKDRALEECAREWQKRLDEETAARIDDARVYQEKLSNLQREVHTAVANLAAVKDVLTRRHHDDDEHTPSPRNPRATGPGRPIR